ncbi:MAG: TetR/AcrR family transcriptional regulator [Bacillota bacterium]
MAKSNKTKRDIILDSAFELFQSRGYYDTKIIDIADAAGIGKGTVYEYFESKEAIFLELFKTKVEASYDYLSELLEKDISCENKIRDHIEFELSNSSKYTFNKNFLMDLMMKSDALKNPKLIESIHRLMNKKFYFVYHIIEDGIRTGEFNRIDPLLATISIMGAINFYIGIHCTPFNPAEFLPAEKLKNLYLEQEKEEFYRLILNGLKKQ